MHMAGATSQRTDASARQGVTDTASELRTDAERGPGREHRERIKLGVHCQLRSRDSQDEAIRIRGGGR